MKISGTDLHAVNTMFGVSFSVQGRGAIHNYHIDMTTNISDIGINDFSLIK